MKLVIATPLYPPDVGGPSYYAASLKASLERQGHEVPVVVLSSYMRFPSGIRHLLYTSALIRAARGSRAILAFDVHATGLSAIIASRIRRISAIIRVGGDFLWEQYLQRTGDLVPLPEFYATTRRLSAKEIVVLGLEKFVVRRAVIAFSCRWIADIWKEPYRIAEPRLRIIENAIPPKLEPAPPKGKNFLFFSRQAAVKNHAAFRRAFGKAQTQCPEIKLDEGVLPHEELLERMRTCYAAVVPSISEVTPNYIIDAIRCNKPFLLTKYSGYTERFGDLGVLVDPLNESDMQRGVEKLADPALYGELCAKISRFNEVRTYDDVARDFLALIEEL